MRGWFMVHAGLLHAWFMVGSWLIIVGNWLDYGWWVMNGLSYGEFMVTARAWLKTGY